MNDDGRPAKNTGGEFQTGGKARVDLHGIVDRSALAAVLTDQYGLQMSEDVNGLEKLYGGYSGSNYRVQLAASTEENPGAAVVLVKVMKGEADGAELEEQGKLLNGPLGSFPFSASPRKLLAQQEGNEFVGTLQGMPVLVLDFLHGITADNAINSNLSSPLSAMYLVGVGLASLHSCALPRGFRTETSGGAGTCAPSIAAAIEPGGELASVGGSPSGDEFLTVLRQRLPTLLQLMAGKEDAEGAGLPLALLHGDAFFDNVIIAPDATLAGFVDWEDAAVGPRLVDLACAVIGCCYVHSSAVCQYHWLEALLQGYQEHIALGDSEIALLADAMQSSLLCNAFFRYRQFNVRYRGVTELSDSHLELLDRLFLLDQTQHREAVISACRMRVPRGFADTHWRFTPGTRYFDGAGRGPLPLQSQEAARQAIADCAHPASLPSAEETVHGIRTHFANLVGIGDAASVAVTPSTSYAMSLVARNIELKAGQRVIVLEGQSGSNVLMWQDLVDRSESASLIVVPKPADLDWTPPLLAAIDSSVGVVSVGNVHWTDGSFVDLESVSDRCRVVGAALCLDLTQSLGAMPFDGSRIRPAFVACSTHKWIHSIHGVSLLYVAPEWVGRVRPLEHHDRNRLGADQPYWDDVGAMTLAGYPTAFMWGARKLDAGGRPNPVLMPTLLKSLEMVVSVGPVQVAAFCAPRIKAIADCARALGYAVPRRHAPHFIGLRIPSLPSNSESNPARGQVWRDLASAALDPAKVHQRLSERGFKLSLRCGAIRVSVYLYTKAGDVFALCAALVQVTHGLVADSRPTA